MVGSRLFFIYYRHKHWNAWLLLVAAASLHRHWAEEAALPPPLYWDSRLSWTVRGSERFVNTDRWAANGMKDGVERRCHPNQKQCVWKTFRKIFCCTWNDEASENTAKSCLDVPVFLKQDPDTCGWWTLAVVLTFVFCCFDMVCLQCCTDHCLKM